MFPNTTTNTIGEGISKSLERHVLFQQCMPSNTSHITSSQIQLSNNTLYNHQRHTLHATEINKRKINRCNNYTINTETTSSVTTHLSTSRIQQNEQHRIMWQNLMSSMHCSTWYNMKNITMTYKLTKMCLPHFPPRTTMSPLASMLYLHKLSLLPLKNQISEI